MAEKAKFTWNEASAELAYDLQNGFADIENFDKEGYDFLSRLKVRDQFILMKSNELMKFVLLDVTDNHGQIKARAQWVKP